MWENEKQSGPCGGRSSYCAVQSEKLAGATKSTSEKSPHHRADGPVGICVCIVRVTVYLSLVATKSHKFVEGRKMNGECYSSHFDADMP